MSRKVFFLPAARREFEAAHDWYERAAPGLGAQFLAEIDRQVERMAGHPDQFPVLLKDVRRARLRRFPYGLFFRVSGDTIHVIACFHASRDPEAWRRR